jgi:hypothetical protein
MYSIAIEPVSKQCWSTRIPIHIARPILLFLKLMALMIPGTCIVGAGCGSANTIWREELRSPDGQWLASADAVQNGGFGSALIQTQVYLEKTNGSNPRKAVLGFSCEGPAARPYTQDNVANKGGTIDLGMKWLSPSHLEVTYNGRANVNLQLTDYDGIEVSLKVTSSEAGKVLH